ncbi:Fe-S cluster assembly protein HesB [Amycolatopsis orientalis]|uniref:DNA-3-methyladenine glycosylase II n=1 Tax=Amycolatopsis orientalis TaxID=31958 RepID=A0A193BU45_AMYOR|nr:DNA-3-methyladenine glycosylase [Amycolatopsis orientalis]ANN15698.1 Fe-S cluster assembly protein HesB [Amycolatopsis orientalis]
MTGSTLQQTTTLRIPVRGPFDLEKSIRFLTDFRPACRADAAAEPGTLRLAFPVEAGWEHVGAAVRQRSPGSIEVEVFAEEALAVEVGAQVRRILSVDVDGVGFAKIGATDPVVGRLQRKFPGLRPVLFHSPYEAACWAILSHRTRMPNAAAVKRRLAEELGRPVDVGGRILRSFPAPDVLAGVEAGPGLTEAKAERLRAVANAAKDGLLDATYLRAMPVPEALRRLQRLPGIGPFSAQLILIRGAGHPDVFPGDEPRVQEAIRTAYDLPRAETEELEELSMAWRPFRSWVAFALRNDREFRMREIGGSMTA